MARLTALALENAALLRVIAANAWPDGKTGLAGLVGRDLSNLNRTLRRLAAADLVVFGPRPALTSAGSEALAALDRAEGLTPSAEQLISQLVAALWLVSMAAHPHRTYPASGDQAAAWAALDAADPLAAAAWRAVDAAVAAAAAAGYRP